MKQTRDELLDAMLVVFKDQIKNPIYRTVLEENNDRDIKRALDACVGIVEGKLKTPWARLVEIFCPEPRVRVEGKVYEGPLRRADEKER